MSVMYTTEHAIVGKDKLVVKIRNIRTGKQSKSRITISDPKVLEYAEGIVSFPLEEIEYGLYENPNLRKLLNGVVKQAKDHLTVSN